MPSTESKYLGITITTDLSWNWHITKVAQKANNTLGFLRRNLKTSPKSTKDCAYKTLVRSRQQLEYACQVWDPYRVKNIQKHVRHPALEKCCPC